MPIAPDIQEYLVELAKRLDATPHRGRGDLLAAAETFLGWSRQTIYRQLKAACGWSSGRKARNDKGKTSVSEQALTMLAATQRESLRENGKQTMFTPVSRGILERNGCALGVSNAHLNRLMRERKMNVGTMRNVTPVQPLRAEHPNYLHQVDPSLCLVYYLKNKQYMIHDDELYKNKLEKLAKLKFKCWRYTGYDRASGAISVRYFEAAGESQHLLFEFLMYMWSKQDDVLLHGVPKYMLWDQGSAMTSSAIKSLLRHLEVENLEHAVKNARAKGGVEGANNIIETQFECRLRFEPVNDVAELNARAEAWAEAYNANLIPGQDTRLRRDGLPTPVARYDLWQLIKSEQLRLLPSVEVCRAFMTSKDVERLVKNDMTIDYKHKSAEHSLQYDLTGLDGVTIGHRVVVRGLVYGDCAIQIEVPRYDGEALFYRVEPVRGYDEFGQRLDAALVGVEFKSRPDTATETKAKKMDELAYPEADAKKSRAKNVAPFGGKLDAHSYLTKIETPAYMPREGQTIDVPDHVNSTMAKLTMTEAMLKISAALRRNLQPEEAGFLRGRYSEGVPEDQLQQLIDQFKNPAPMAAPGSGLRVVGNE